ncbi:conserved hypothetical protein, partial [Ricinus communis]
GSGDDNQREAEHGNEHKRQYCDGRSVGESPGDQLVQKRPCRNDEDSAPCKRQHQVVQHEPEGDEKNGGK